MGMVLIIAGLYSFLWGRREDTKVAPPPVEETGCGGGGVHVRAEETTLESGGLQSSASIVPTVSPNTSH